MQNILFIGGAGYIGSSIIKHLLKEDKYSITVMEPHFANVSRLDNCDVNIVRGQLIDIDLLEMLITTKKITKVVHLVSTMVPGCNYDDYVNEFKNIIFPTIRLMQLCSRHNVQFIFFSSGGTVYGERNTTIPFKETDPLMPISYYGLSKQVIENHILFEHRVSGLEYLILRPSNPYGHGQNIYARQGLIAVAIGKVLSDDTITIWGDGNSVRDYIYIDDLAEVFKRILLSDKSNDTINIGSGIGYSIKDIIGYLENVVGKKINVEFAPSRNSDVTNMILNNERMMQIANITLTPIQEGIRMFYNYEKSIAR
ncbi:MAG: NAD-dependent epimerase/dehydratase family protein [Prevotella sp.]|nr:NAD-dependent epimerase/dehydratase family protein [Candidatus Prevotella equi]